MALSPDLRTVGYLHLDTDTGKPVGRVYRSPGAAWRAAEGNAGVRVARCAVARGDAMPLEGRGVGVVLMLGEKLFGDAVYATGMEAEVAVERIFSRLYHSKAVVKRRDSQLRRPRVALLVV